MSYQSGGGGDAPLNMPLVLCPGCPLTNRLYNGDEGPVLEFPLYHVISGWKMEYHTV